ncbi:hypothetical protein ANN_05127 [Periplaneta americana]|uniref:Uncharacterized protein n=1 Tax=Periplaneta americana TaxID=6978 RepID=A0ABQ8TAA4_PERAM|nr:hypothetical protein ANN_05127 [Periplaneta americana]
MTGLCEGGNEPPGSLKAVSVSRLERWTTILWTRVRSLVYSRFMTLLDKLVVQNASYDVYEEVGCVSSDGSTRRADTIIIDRQKDKGVILDPTIRFEMHEQQPQEVCREKQVIYEPCCQHLGAQYHITHWTVFGLMFGARVGPYHHGMARPQVADRGDSLQIWRVAVNILNKQSRTADEGWSSSLGVGRRANNPSP